jgi:hypothetical protein
VSLAALSLVILAGLVHASWNIFAKKSGGDLRIIALTSLVILWVWMPVGLGVGWSVARGSGPLLSALPWS